MRTRAVAIASVCAVLMSACSDSGPSRAAVMTKMADSTIVPRFISSAESASKVSTDVASACVDHSASTLETAKSSLRRARIDWGHVQAMAVGPVMDRRSVAKVDYAVDTEAVLRVATGTTPAQLDEQTVGSGIGANQRGYGALDVLLGTQSLAVPRVCDYATSIAKAAEAEQSAVVDAWTKQVGSEKPYREVLAEDATMSLDDMVNDSINLLRAISDTQLRAAVGTETKKGDPAALHEGPSGDGAAIIESHLSGVRSVMEGISVLLSDELNTRLKAALEAAISKAHMEQPLATVLANNPIALVELAAKIDEVRKILVSEIVSVLGITVGFSDSDGDSSG